MKKVILLFLLIYSGCLFAAQCPSASSLSRPISGKDWKLDTKSLQQGWYVAYTDYNGKISTATKLDYYDNLVVTLYLNSSRNQAEVVCYYGHRPSNPIYPVNEVQHYIIIRNKSGFTPFNEAKLNWSYKPRDSTYFSCKTNVFTEANCAW